MFSKSAIWVVVALLLFMLFKQFDNHSTTGGAKPIAYSELLDDIKARRLKDVVIEGQNITALRTDDTKVRANTTGLDKGLVSDLVNNGIHFDIKPPEEAGFLSQIFISWFPMLLLIGVWVFFMRQMQGGGKGGAFSFGKSKARMMDETNNTVTFADVACCDEAKEEVNEIVDFLKDPTKFQKLGGRIPRGVLMVGPPGTGKTLLARAIAGEAKVPFFSISGSDFVEMFVGVGASRVRDMFENAKKHSPCIIFIDEIDAVGRHRGAGMGGGNDEREQTLNQLLVEMDGFEANSGVIVVAATNRADVKADILARGTPGFSGADLANLVNEAALFAARRSKRLVEMADFEDAKDKIYMGPERKSMVMREEERRNTAYHESGHAVIAKLMPKADPVHKVTIMPRGYALGLTWQLPEHDALSGYKDKMLEEISILFGGRIAEEIFVGQMSTGASNDFSRATKLARSMVTRFGMSDSMGVMVYEDSENEGFFAGATKTISEATQQKVDAEIRNILDTQYALARRLLEENRDKVEAMTRALLDWETIDADQINDIMAGHEPRSPSANNVTKRTPPSGDSGTGGVSPNATAPA